jgi:hypothetical protein
MSVDFTTADLARLQPGEVLGIVNATRDKDGLVLDYGVSTLSEFTAHACDDW